MPRYFFHVIDGKDLPDHEGTVLANADEARAEAIILSGARTPKASSSPTPALPAAKRSH